MAAFFVFIIQNFNHEIHEPHENFYLLVLVLGFQFSITRTITRTTTRTIPNKKPRRIEPAGLGNFQHD
jgi:hypothetical protein